MPEDNLTLDNSEGASTSTDDDYEIPADSSTDGNGDDTNKGDTKEDEKQTRTDAIANALGESESEGESPASKKSDQDKEAEEEGEKKKDADVDSRLDKNPRFQAVIAEKNTLQEKLKQYEPADSTMNDKDRLATLHIGESVNRALLGQANPQDVLAMLAPIVEQLQSAAGLVLPDDLKQAVENGDISEKYARDLAKERASNAAMQNSSEFEKNKQKEEQTRKDNEYLARLNDGVKKAVVDWEVIQKAKDPDYALKSSLVYAQINAVALSRKTAGMLTTPEDAVKIADQALKQVSELLQKAAPGKRQIRPNLQGSTPAGKPIQAKPADRRAAIAAALD
ncbi:MAG: hypothetical protein V4721_00470 [Bacteroidota bacterium]